MPDIAEILPTSFTPFKPTFGCSEKETGSSSDSLQEADADRRRHARRRVGNEREKK